MAGSRPSFIPPAPQRHLRELTRYRSTLVAERARLVNRVHKLLEDTNLKLTAVVTDVTGVSARAMLAALLSGETDPETLALLARAKLRKKREQLAQALQGHLQPHHRFLLTTQLAHLDFLDEQVAHCDSEIQRHMTHSIPPAVSAEPSVTAPRDEPPPELTPLQATPPSSPVEEAKRAPAASTPLSFAEALSPDTIPGSINDSPRSSWRRSVRICRAFPMPSISPPGLVSVLAITRALANISAARRARGIDGCARP